MLSLNQSRPHGDVSATLVTSPGWSKNTHFHYVFCFAWVLQKLGKERLSLVGLHGLLVLLWNVFEVFESFTQPHWSDMVMCVFVCVCVCVCVCMHLYVFVTHNCEHSKNQTWYNITLKLYPVGPFSADVSINFFVILLFLTLPVFQFSMLLW